MDFISYANNALRVSSRKHVWNSAISCAHVAQVSLLILLQKAKLGTRVTFGTNLRGHLKFKT